MSLLFLRQSSATFRVALMLPREVGRRLRCVAVFLAAYMASHKLTCTSLSGVPNPNHNGEPRINPGDACSPPTRRQHDDLASSRSPPDRGSFFGQSIRTVPISKDMEAHLLILARLRNNAADCIRLAEAARTSEHKSLFIEMAERWLTLAEQAERTRG